MLPDDIIQPFADKRLPAGAVRPMRSDSRQISAPPPGESQSPVNTEGIRRQDQDGLVDQKYINNKLALAGAR